MTENESAFDLLYCITFKLMDHLWLAMHASYMDFNVCASFSCDDVKWTGIIKLLGVEPTAVLRKIICLVLCSLIKKYATLDMMCIFQQPCSD